MKRQKKLLPYSADEIAADPDVAAALVRESEPLLHIERQMKALREQKADLFDDLRLSRYKPEFAKAWVAAQMPDEERDAARAEKAIELARVVAAMEVAKANSGRARAGARVTHTSAPRQEEIDQETGEVLGDAPAPSPESLGPLHTQEEQPSPSEPRSLTDEPPSAHSSSACANPAAGQEVTGQSGMTATVPYRVTDPAPEPAAPDPDVSPLIADATARQAAARKLLGQAEVVAE